MTDDTRYSWATGLLIFGTLFGVIGGLVYICSGGEDTYTKTHYRDITAEEEEAIKLLVIPQLEAKYDIWVSEGKPTPYRSTYMENVFRSMHKTAAEQVIRETLAVTEEITEVKPKGKMWIFWTSLFGLCYFFGLGFLFTTSRLWEQIVARSELRTERLKIRNKNEREQFEEFKAHLAKLDQWTEDAMKSSQN